MDRPWLPVAKSIGAWLNERHYGALQNLNKAETAKKHGDAQVLVWRRRSYDTPPPAPGTPEAASEIRRRPPLRRSGPTDVPADHA